MNSYFVNLTWEEELGIGNRDLYWKRGVIASVLPRTNKPTLVLGAAATITIITKNRSRSKVKTQNRKKRLVLILGRNQN